MVFIFWELSSSTCAVVHDCVKAARTGLIGIFELNSPLKQKKTPKLERVSQQLPEHELIASCIIFSKNTVTLHCSGYKTSVELALILQNLDAVNIYTFIAVVAGRHFFPFRKSAAMPSFHRVMLYNTIVLKLLPCSPSATRLNRFSF